jgi:hypothetical protein
MAMNFFDAAADLVSLGFSVIPLRPNAKLPLVKAWQRLASSELETITHWSRQWPNANIGIATGDASGICVIDLDVKDDRNGIETIAALAKAGKVFPPCPTVETPSGGRHLYFRMEKGLKNVVGVTGAGRGLGSGVDFRARGGFVVAPPSVLPNGAYRWLLPPMTADFPRLPDWALKMLMPPPPKFAPRFQGKAAAGEAEQSLEGIAHCVATAPAGQRNNMLYWASYTAGGMARDGRVEWAAASSRLTDAALAAGLPMPEVQATIESGRRWAFGGAA